LGGQAGAQLSQRLDYRVSGSTLLSLLAKLPLPPIVTPTVLGVDDFAFAKHQSYGTILVDLDQSCPIALLSNREAETLAQWLRQHPGIEVLSRDRSTTYRSGMSQGAPNAIQVADRFHLLQNLAEVLEQALAGQAEVLQRVARSQRSALDASQASETLISPTCPSPSVEQLSQQRRAQRLRNYEQVWQLHQQGCSTGVIAQKVGVSRRSVQRYLLSNQFPERQAARHQGRSLLKPYKPYLLEQWNQGDPDQNPL
jgi:DNA-binding NarL/FixJ family response regulator